ncbi:MAG: hypothetical protein K0U34_01510 [Alphaproteobacteria bacterium]|nr:hypothetical protein [Alphaproteobacteria bacterium]
MRPSVEYGVRGCNPFWGAVEATLNLDGDVTVTHVSKHVRAAAAATLFATVGVMSPAVADNHEKSEGWLCSTVGLFCADAAAPKEDATKSKSDAAPAEAPAAAAAPAEAPAAAAAPAEAPAAAAEPATAPAASTDAAAPAADAAAPATP